MTVLEGEDDRVLVEGRWASREAFDAAVTSNESARLSREALGAFGRPEPGLFREDLRVGPIEPAENFYPSSAFWDTFRRRKVDVNGLKHNVVEGGQGEPVL